MLWVAIALAFFGGLVSKANEKHASCESKLCDAFTFEENFISNIKIEKAANLPNLN